MRLVHPLTELMGISAICLGILTGAYLVLNHETHLFGIRITSRGVEHDGFNGVLRRNHRHN